MIELLQMWALVEVIGIVCLPLTITVFHNLLDRGWAFSKTLALAYLAFFIWLPLMCLHFLPFNQFFILGTACFLLVLNLLALLHVRHTLIQMVRLNLPYILVTEAIFLSMVFLLGWLHTYGPDIRSYEMFMDEGFIASIMRSEHLPPNDMWFSGYPINYYYYAHFTIAALAKLIGQSPSIAFNTGICILFGLTASNLFGVSCNIVAWARSLRKHINSEQAGTAHSPLLPTVPFGLLTIVIGLMLGNLAATQQWWQQYNDGKPYDWFGPSRVIEKTINEFPAFSFLLSDFHAHVLTLAFTILAIGLAFNLFLATDKGLSVFGRGWQLFLTLSTTALVLGALFTMNGWDYPSYVGLVLVCIVLQQWLAHGTHVRPRLLLDIFTAGTCLLALSFLLYLPFHLNFLSPAQGIGIVLAADRSPLRAVLLIYGLFAFLYLSLLVVSGSNHPLIAFSSIVKAINDEKTRRLWTGIGTACIIGFVLVGFVLLFLLSNSVTFLVCACITLLGIILLFYHIGDRSLAFTLLLGALAFALVAGCEVFFLRDVFAGNYPRMNTVFKFYFQAWALLSITSGAGLFFILESLRPSRTVSFNSLLLQHLVRALWSIGLLILLLAAAVYPLVAPFARYARTDSLTGHSYLQRTNSLDGLSYLATDPAHPGDYAAIRWLNANVQGDPVIIEAIGDDYSNYGRISAFTGLPTPMGWVGHEYQWRVNWLHNPAHESEFHRRSADVDLIYNSTDPRLVLSTMARYHAQYLYVGHLEHIKYPHIDLHSFSKFMQVIYNIDGVTIYKTK
jgi:YYY domain-containing protein